MNSNGYIYFRGEIRNITILLLLTIGLGQEYSLQFYGSIEYVEIENSEPFNPVTTLRFALPSKVKVILEVYDINGRLVKELQSGLMEAGYHSVVWNAQSTASGIYFVKLHAGEFLKTQKLMLVK